MNSRYRSLVLAVAAASLVGLAQAQSSTSGSSSTGSTASRPAGSSTSSSTSASPSSSQNQSSSSTMRGSSTTDRSHTMSSTTQGSASGSVGAASLQRVTKDSLDHQLTAKGLIGKDVHDSAGEKIGEVEDIVLDASQLSQLASAFMNRDSDRARTSTASTTGAAGSPSARSTDTYAAGAAGDGASATGARSDANVARSTLESQARSALSGAMSSGPAAIVSAGGIMGIGQDLIRVPLSQLRYDASEDRVTLDVSREQISRLTESDTTSSRVAE